MKVLFVSFEATGIYKTGGLGDVAASLPVALKKKGVDISIVMPGYNGIKKPKVLPGRNVPVFYIKDKDYFDLTKKYTHAQNFERFFYFCKKVVDLIKKEKPDIVHLNDWHTGMVAYLLKIPSTKFQVPNKFQISNLRPELKSRDFKFQIKQKKFKIPKIILTIHNAGFQGDFSLDHVDDFENKKIKEEFLKLGFKRRVNFLKLAIDYSDFVNTVSENYADEILNKGFGYGLEKNLRKKGKNFIGILNGIDYEKWNPEKDRWIETKYTNKQSSIKKINDKFQISRLNKAKIYNWQIGKKLNKVALQRKLRLPVDPYVPVIAFIARLSWQKGIEKIIEGIEELSKMDLQLIILGKGDKFYEEKLIKLSKKYGDRFLSVRIKFDEKLAHQIYAGSDLFLIPSRYEPCGLTQMIAMRYGTIPLARRTGGLADTIKDGKTGFLFGDDSPKPMLRAVKRAVGVYYNWIDWKQLKSQIPNPKTQKEKNEKFLVWEEMVERAMRENFSWEKSAQKYLSVYKGLLK